MNANALLKRFLAGALLASLLLATTASPAQSTPKPSPPKKAPYSIEIQEGILLLPEGKTTEATLENVVELLRELEQSRLVNPANIVLSPDLPKIKIANLKLTGTMLPQELEALRVVSGERFTWSAGENPGTVINPTTGLPLGYGMPGQPANPPPDQVPLYILRPAPESGRGRLRVEAFSLAGYFESRKKSGDEKENQRMVEEEIQELHRIVKETVAIYVDMNQEMNRDETSSISSPSLRFHRGANLLIVTGEIDAVEIAAKVIGALPHVQRSGGDGTGGYGGGGMGIPGRMPTHSELFKNRYGIGVAPQPGVGGPGAPPIAR